jgi:hypothetical protein
MVREACSYHRNFVMDLYLEPEILGGNVSKYCTRDASYYLGENSDWELIRRELRIC